MIDFIWQAIVKPVHVYAPAPFKTTVSVKPKTSDDMSLDMEKIVDTLESWIDSAKEDAHLDLCQEAVYKFLEHRFYLDVLMPFLVDRLNDRIKYMRTKINSLHLITTKS